jgi:hypothetical protein
MTATDNFQPGWQPGQRRTPNINKAAREELRLLVTEWHGEGISHAEMHAKLEKMGRPAT